MVKLSQTKQNSNPPPKKAKKNNTDTDLKIIFVFTVEEKVKGNMIMAHYVCE